MHLRISAILAAAALASQATAEDGRPDNSQPALFQRLLDCRTVAQPEQRLACFDRQSAEVEEAARKRDLVVSDKETVKAARRQLFGFNLSLGKLFGDGGKPAEAGDDAAEIREIETTVAGVRRTANGWRLELADGTTWEQNDTRDFALSPKIGNGVRITRGALGTYFVSVQRQRAIKMRRTQ